MYGSHAYEEMDDAKAYGWVVEGLKHNWNTLIEAKDTELNRLHEIYVRLLENANVDRYHGRGTVVNSHSVRVGGRILTAERIMIAVGGWPTLPEVEGIQHAITSNEALDLKELPKRVMIVGSGYIAVEFAGIFKGLGAKVDLVFRADKLLRGFDEDVRITLTNEILKKGINIVSETLPNRIEKTKTGVRVFLTNSDAIDVDQIMYATGRGPNTKGLGLETVGVDLSRSGAVKVDEWSQSTVPSIFAIGDVTDRINLTPVAIAEGRAFAETTYNGNPISVDHEDVPSAVFSQPPVGSVGLPEHLARDKYGQIDVYVANFKPMKYTLTSNPERGLQKLIVDRATQRVVGAHMVGVDAPEIIQGIGIAVKMKAKKSDFDATIGIHPTAAEEFVTMRDKRPDD